MKKSLMTLMAALLMTAGLQAQDTIHTRFLKEGYLPYGWINTNPTDENPLNGLSFERYLNVTEYLALTAKYFYTEEEIPIYGIAAGLLTDGPDGSSQHFMLDTSWDNAYEYFALYKRRLDTVVLDPISDSLVFHLRNTPISYYMDLDGGFQSNPYLYVPLPPIPVYERYFDSAYSVTDSFYVGWTHRSVNYHVKDSNGTRWEWGSWPVVIFGLAPDPCDPNMLDRLLVHNDLSDQPTEEDGVPINYGPEWYYYGRTAIYFIFPILTPEPPEDTTSVAVAPVRPLERLVSVQPNPATERVTVLSSFGMTHLTAYDAAGVKVYDQAAAGLKADLDVKGWPAGTYILHVQTPMGVSTKRLIVTR